MWDASLFGDWVHQGVTRAATTILVMASRGATGIAIAECWQCGVHSGCGCRITASIHNVALYG